MKTFIENPVVTIDKMDNESPLFVLHNYIRQNNVVVMNTTEASLLYIELHKFLTDFEVNKKTK